MASITVHKKERLSSQTSVPKKQIKIITSKKYLGAVTLPPIRTCTIYGGVLNKNKTYESYYSVLYHTTKCSRVAVYTVNMKKLFMASVPQVYHRSTSLILYWSIPAWIYTSSFFFTFLLNSFSPIFLTASCLDE